MVFHAASLLLPIVGRSTARAGSAIPCPRWSLLLQERYSLPAPCGFSPISRPVFAGRQLARAPRQEECAPQFGVSQKLPDISVIVPAFNAAATLGACIESLLSQTLAPLEIIVVDDASSDDTASVASRYAVRLVRLGSNGGPGVARNAGAREAIGNVLAFTDADCVAPPAWLERLFAALDRPGISAVTGGYAGPQCDGFLTRLQHLVIRQRQAQLPAEIESAITSNLMCRAGAFHAAGGFPLYWRRTDRETPVWGNEDEELGFLLSRQGRILWLSDVGVLHSFRGDVSGYFRQQRFYAERIVMSHFRFPDMASSRTNYSRLSGLVHLVTTLGVVVGAATAAIALTACETLQWPALDTARSGWSDLLCVAGGGMLALSFPVYLLLPLPTLGALRRQGERMGFLFRAYPVLLAIEAAWFFGAVRGTLLSLGGFVDGNREPRATSPALDR